MMCSSTVAQLVEQLPHNQEVMGSNPSLTVFFNFSFFSLVTSLVSTGTGTTCKQCKKDKFTLASHSTILALLGLPALEIVIGISLSNLRFTLAQLDYEATAPTTELLLLSTLQGLTPGERGLKQLGNNVKKTHWRLARQSAVCLACLLLKPKENL